MHVRSLGLCLVLTCVLAVGQQTQPAPSSDPQSSDPQSTEAKSSADSKALQLDLTPDVNGKLSQEQMQQLLRVVAEKDEENDKRLRNYTYIERDVQHNNDGKGQLKKTEIKTFEVLEIYGEQVQRLIEKDDEPLNDKEAAKEEEKIQKIIDKRKNESDEERKNRSRSRKRSAKMVASLCARSQTPLSSR